MPGDDPMDLDFTQVLRRRPMGEAAPAAPSPAPTPPPAAQPPAGATTQPVRAPAAAPAPVAKTPAPAPAPKPAAPAPAAPAPAAPAPAAAKPAAPAARPAAPAAEPRIGEYAAGKGNLVTYVKLNAVRAPAAADAPVLIVDDDEDTRRLMERAMVLHGLPVRMAADSKEVAQAMRKPPQPRLILLDIDLPGTNGFRIMQLLRQNPQTASIPIVLVTSHSEPSDVIQGLSLGADGYLSKPLSIATLRAAVAKVLQCKQ
jgi:CheY-like chemotaxis protein